nr:hypothetical protein [Propionicimonas sp.]
MALLIETHPSARIAPRPSRRRLTPSRPARAVYSVPEGGLLLFPGAPAGIAAPAQLGPDMVFPPR